jgi:uncharacterized protein (TIGR02611 family)
MARRFQPPEESQVRDLGEEQNSELHPTTDLSEQSTSPDSSDPNRLERFLARIRSTPAGRLVLRIAITVLGTVIIATGIVLLPLPGPGWLIIFAGLALWSLEFHWARRLNHFVRRHVGRWTNWYARQGWTVRIVVGLLTGLFVLAIIVLSLRISFGPSVFDRIQSIF